MLKILHSLYVDAHKTGLLHISFCTKIILMKGTLVILANPVVWLFLSHHHTLPFTCSRLDFSRSITRWRGLQWVEVAVILCTCYLTYLVKYHQVIICRCYGNGICTNTKCYYGNFVCGHDLFLSNLFTQDGIQYMPHRSLQSWITQIVGQLSDCWEFELP